MKSGEFKPRKCFNCNKSGHIAEDCRFEKQEEKTKVKEEKTSSIVNPNRLFVNAEINGKKVLLLVDTGSSTTLIPKEIISPAIKCSKEFKTVTNEPIKIHGASEVIIKIGNFEVFHNVYVADTSEAILGMDFLRKH